MNNYANKKIKDDVLQELWDAKDYYSLSCNSNFRELVKKVKEDIKKLDVMNEHNEIEKVEPED
ncbi:hypothetical protein JCM12298_26230 [Desulfothermus naphthae]